VDREISIITPVAGPHVALLPQAWESIKSQDVPRGWKIRWYVQEDGPASSAQSFVQGLGDGLAEFSTSGSAGGAAEARNLALSRSNGEVVMLLDADDQLTAGAVQRVVASLQSGNMWCGFGALDNRDGTHSSRTGGYSLRLGTDRVAAPESAQFNDKAWLGRVMRGAMRQCWEQFGVLPFHPATFATYAQWIWDSGGWPGLARDEDTALILSITDKHSGIVSDEPNIMYRRHVEQTSQRVPPNDERLAFIRRRR